LRIEVWNEIMEKMCDLMGYDKGMNACIEAKRSVKPKTPLYELSSREDKHLIFKLRKIYGDYRKSMSRNL